MSITSVLKFSATEDVKLLDARGPRFGAVLTTIVLAAILVTGSLPLLVWQLSVFAFGAFVGPQATPYAWIYRTFVKPRLRGDLPTEDASPGNLEHCALDRIALGARAGAAELGQLRQCAVGLPGVEQQRCGFTGGTVIEHGEHPGRH